MGHISAGEGQHFHNGTQSTELNNTEVFCVK